MNIGLVQLRFDILTVIIVCFVLIEVSLIIYSHYFRGAELSEAPVSAFQSISHQQLINRSNVCTKDELYLSFCCFSFFFSLKIIIFCVLFEPL